MSKNLSLYQSTVDQRGRSPWTLGMRVRVLCWQLSWLVLCKWTPKPLNRWRLCVLRIFGVKIDRRAFVHQRARIHIPWNLTLHYRACLGEGAYIYTLDKVEIGARATIAQEVFLSTGSHDFSHPNCPLVTGKITIGADAFIGARAFVMPGIEIGEGAVIGACSVVTKDVPEWTFNAGNPCRMLRPREKFKEEIPVNSR